MGFSNTLKLVVVQIFIISTLVITIYIKNTIDEKGGDDPVGGLKNHALWRTHPIYLVAAFVVLGSEAALAYRFLPLSHDNQKLVHLILQTVAMALAITGVYNMWKFKESNDILPHFYSLHSVVGLAAMGLYGLQWLWGILAFFIKVLNDDARRAFLPWHIFIGLTSYFFVTVTCVLGVLDYQRIYWGGSTNPHPEQDYKTNWYHALGLLIMVTMTLVAFMLSKLSKTKDEGETDNEHHYLKDDYGAF